MSDCEARAEFGVRAPEITYAPRPGAYAVIADTYGRVAVMRTPRGCFLPDGGTEGDESPEETLAREVREECGLGVQIIGRLGEAVEYVHTAGHKVGQLKEGVFFRAAIAEACGSPSEADHALIWLEPQEAQAALAHGSQRWAVRQYVRRELRGGHPQADTASGGGP